MKKILLLFLILFIGLPCLCAYRPIPSDKKLEYKEQMTNYIDTNYIDTANKTYNNYLEAQTTFYQFLKTKQPKDKDKIIECYEWGVDEPLFFYYKGLLELTQKFANIPLDELPATDYSGDLYEFLEPYFKDNNINTKKFDELAEFAHFTEKRIEKYYNIAAPDNGN